MTTDEKPQTALTTSIANGKARLVTALVLDAGPILSSAAAPSFYLTAADRIYTTPAVVAEIRDPAARSRWEMVWKPFVTVRAAKADSVKEVAEFAKKTGDYRVLSATDLGLLALGYELECEVASGDWRLRKTPGGEYRGKLKEGWGWEGKIITAGEQEEETKFEEKKKDGAEEVTEKLEAVKLDEAEEKKNTPPSNVHELEEDSEEESEEEDDDGGWITPSNLHKHTQLVPNTASAAAAGKYKLTVALSTTDFALQNTLIQLNLNLLSPTSLARITSVRSTVLRCHACFFLLRHPSPTTPTNFCPRCGSPSTLTRVTCSTDSQTGKFQIHLKKNWQYNTRGTVYSLPKPVHGTSSMKGVPDAPVLREDQKEYVRKVRWEGYRKERDLMDQDRLPAILSGERRRGGGLGVGWTERGRNPNEPRRGGGKRKK